MMSEHEMYAVDLSHETAMYTSDSFMTYAEAVGYLDTVVDSWEAELGIVADRSWASSDNMYAARCGDRTAQVVREEAN